MAYATALADQKPPKNLVFTYAVSQAGPRDIEETHRVFRSGLAVRDETLAIGGHPLKVAERVVRIAHYRDRYTLSALAPRPAAYALQFETARRTGSRYAYAFRAVPLTAGAYAVDAIAIDGTAFLPTSLHFHIGSRSGIARGTVRFARFGRYWMPVEVSVTAKLAGKPARERIAFGGYQFPASLPQSTFRVPKPLPTPPLPTF